MKTTRTTISYIFTIPASALFYIAEKIRGEKIAWRYKEVMGNTEMTCTKCGHKAIPSLNKK